MSSLRKRIANSPTTRRRLTVAAVSTGLIALCGASVADAAPANQAAQGAGSHFTSAVAPARPLSAVAPTVHGIPEATGAPIAAPLTARPKPAPRFAPRIGGSVQGLAHQIVPASQFSSFSQIISHESGWNVHATNPSSGAYGLGQALPASKMSAAGGNWHDDPATQIRWTYNYMNSRYGSPNAAWAFWQGHHWY